MNTVAIKQEVSETNAVLAMIERVAMNPEVDIDKLERMLAMQERILDRNAEQAFNAAMSDAQKETGRVSADATNPQTRSRYATYAALDRALRPIYTSHGLSLSFDTGDAIEGHVRVVCYVAHRDGHSRTYHADMPADGLGAKGNAVMTKTHAAGSAMSYGMRYLLKLIFNVAVGEDDNDGNGAEQPQGIQPHVEDAIVAISKVDSMNELQGLWESLGEKLTKPELMMLIPAKDNAKRRIAHGTEK